MRKRIGCLLLALILCLSLLPAAAWAAEPSDSGTAQTQQTAAEADTPVIPNTPDEPETTESDGAAAVQALIDALPDADSVTAENAGAVQAALEAINKAKASLTDEQAALVDFTRYDGAAAALEVLAEQDGAAQPALTANDADRPSGDGTKEHPYQIGTLDELAWFRDTVNDGETEICAELTGDIDGSKAADKWGAIGTYSGTFSGNGHTITIQVPFSTAQWSAGLFREILEGGVVEDLRVEVKNSNPRNTGAIAAANKGTIRRCSSAGLYSDGYAIGGIVYKNEGVIEDCYVNGSVYGKAAGGIASWNTGTIRSCCFLGSVVDNSSSAGQKDVTAANHFVDATYSSTGTVVNCFYLANSGDNDARTQAQFASGEVTLALNNGERTESGSPWFQNLPDNGDGLTGSDTYPVLDERHGRVYCTASGNYTSLIPHKHCVCSGNTAVGSHTAHDTAEFTAWTGDGASASLPGSGRYVLMSDVALRAAWKITGDVTLCLNGFAVSGNITVADGGSLTLSDCRNGTLTGRVTVNEGGSFALFGGTITSDKANEGSMDNISGVENKGSFTMYGGSLSGNHTNTPTVDNSGSFAMYGGSITDDWFGVTSSGTMTLGGKVNISGNDKANVLLRKGKTITVAGTLHQDSSVGITTDEKPSGEGVTITVGGAASAERFFADVSGYGIHASGENLILTGEVNTHRHCVCGDGEDITGHESHEDVTFQRWESNTSLPTENGYYYLTRDVVLSGTWMRGGDVTLCLNGHTISSAQESPSSKPQNVIYAGGNSDSDIMTLTDCNAAPGSVDAGKTHGGIRIADGCTLNLYKITVANSSYTSGVYNNGGTLNLYDGVISGNTAKGSTAGGNYGASGDYSSNNGGGVYNKGTFNMYGGAITDNLAGIYGSIVRKWGTGGGVYNEGIFNMYGGTISGNTAEASGGGVYNSGTFSLYGGTISGNATGSTGGGVHNGGTMRLSGDVTISGNRNSQTGGRSNAYLNTDDGIIITGALTGSGSIGAVNDNRSMPVARGGAAEDGGDAYVLTEADAERFFCDETYGIQLDTKNNRLILASYMVTVTDRNGKVQGFSGESDAAVLAQALAAAAAKPGSTLTLHKNAAKGATFKLTDTLTVSSGTFTIDLGTCEISGANPLVISGSADITLKGSEIKNQSGSYRYYRTGSIINTSDSADSCAVRLDGGRLTIEAGAKVTLYRSSGDSPALYISGGEAIIRGGALYSQSGAAIRITDGKLTYSAKNSTSYYDQQGYSRESSTSIAVSGGEVNITGGRLDCTNTCLDVTGGKVTITGGEFPRTIRVPEGHAVSELLGNGYGYKVANKNQWVWAKPENCTGAEISDVLVAATPLTSVTITPTEVTLKPGYTADEAPTFTVTATKAEGVTAKIEFQYWQVGTPASDGSISYTKINNYPCSQPYTFPVGQPEGVYYYRGFVVCDKYYVYADAAVRVVDKETAKVAISGMPESVAYGDILTLTASQTDDTGTDGTWRWSYDEKLFREVSSDDAAGTIRLQAIAVTDAAAEITASYESDTYEGSRSVTAGSIGKKTLTEKDLTGIPASLEKVYDGTDKHTASVTLTLADSARVNDTDSLRITVEKTNIVYDSADAGKAASAVLTLPDISDNPHYRLAKGQIAVSASITPRAITIQSVTAKSRDYEKDNRSVEITGAAFGNLPDGVTLVKGTDYTASGTMKDANAGADKPVEVTVTLNGGNYSLAESVFTTAVEIRQAAAPSLSAAPIPQRWYDTETHEVTPQWKGIPDDAGELNFRITGTNTPTGVSSYGGWRMEETTGTLRYALAGAKKEHVGAGIVLTVSVSSTNYQTSTVDLTIRITDRAEQTSFAFAAGSRTAAYGDADFTVKASGAAKESSVTYTSSNAAVATVDNDGKVHIVGAGTAVITARASRTEDYNEKTVSYTLTVAKKQITAPDADDTVYTYNGQEQTYRLAENAAYTISGNRQINANEDGYSVTVALKDKANTMWAGGNDDTEDRTYRFLIHKAAVTVTVMDRRAYTGAAAPALGEGSYTVSGLLNGDTLDAAITVRYVDAGGSAITPNMAKAGETIIRASAAASGNYTVTCVDGRLTVSARPGGGRSSRR